MVLRNGLKTWLLGASIIDPQCFLRKVKDMVLRYFLDLSALLFLLLLFTFTVITLQLYSMALMNS